MSVILVKIINHLKVAKRPLTKVRFQGLLIRTADYRETLLNY